MKRILVIDDDVDLLASAKLFLESNNYEVTTAVNTKLGSELMKTFGPDLIVLDVMMDTNLEGFNFLNSLKSEEAYRNIPVVMNTGMAKAMGVNLRASVEDVDYLPQVRFVDKSGDWEELINVIKELLP